MKFQAIFLAVVLTAVLAAYAVNKCCENESWTGCGSTCPRACDSPTGRVCTM
ncbi:hypothetical protein NYO67_2127 [Aspergillus flavus]|nr:hypothetical protein NYO67_2127 [Aspergillus flavus]